MNYIVELLSNSGYIMYNKRLASLLGVTGTVLMGELCAKYQYWYENGALIKNDGWFFIGQKDIKTDTGLSPYQQRTALAKLQEKGLLKVKRRDNPSRYWYCLDVEKLNDLLLRNLITSGKESPPPEVKERKHNIRNKKKENKKENTSYFYIFWERYPRKESKKKAMEAFAKLKVDSRLCAEMLKALEMQKQSSQWQEKRYIPYASTWLNQRRWEDVEEDAGAERDVLPDITPELIRQAWDSDDSISANELKNQSLEELLSI